MYMKTSVLALAIAATSAQADTIFRNGFELAPCDTGQRQLTARISFLSNPGRIYNQPLRTFGDVFGFYFDCPGSTCTDVEPFPGTNTVPIINMRNDRFMALSFNTSNLDPLQFAGSLTVSTSNQVWSRTEWSMSDTCGDFDPHSVWLSEHPNCLKELIPEAVRFGWTVFPTSAFNCVILTDGVNDPTTTWWLNMRVKDCDTSPTCNVNVKNQGG